MKTKHTTPLEERFYKKCQVLELKYEYPGYTGTEKYAIVTSLPIEELNEYKDLLNVFTPYIVLDESFANARSEYKRNEHKHEMRALRGHIFAIDEEFTEHHPEYASEDCATGMLLEERSRELWQAIRKLTPIQQRRVAKYFFLGESTRKIAEDEGVNYSKVDNSIKAALKKLRKFVK